jgi:hypothetical protein
LSACAIEHFSRASLCFLPSSPGAYSTRDDWNKRGAKRQNRQGIPGKRQGGVEWVRVSAPPSIPAPAQSFGYEENQSGELILQTPARLPGHSGVGADQLGPGEYVTEAHQNILANERKKGFVEWSKSKTHRDGREAMLRRAASQPAPGQYTHSSETIESRRKGKKISPFFASKVNRLKSLDGDTSKGAREPVPGPGTYAVSSSFDRITSAFVPEAYQFFGSKTNRVVGGILPANNVTPGPGSYKIPSSTLKVGDPSTSDPYAPSLAFKSTSTRFEKDRSVEQPGPGAYRDLSNTSVELAKKIFGRNTSFGTTEQRFAAEKQAQHARAQFSDLGPTSYSPRHTGAIKLGRKPLSVFVSATKRFDAASGKSVQEEKTNVDRANQAVASFLASQPVGIGHEPMWGNYSKHQAASSAFAAKTDRFDERSARKLLASSPAVGPGTYHTSYTANAANLYRTAPAVSSSFKATSRDAAGGLNSVYKKENVPGPGSYQRDLTAPQNSTFITRSFNITIAD